MEKSPEQVPENPAEQAQIQETGGRITKIEEEVTPIELPIIPIEEEDYWDKETIEQANDYLEYLEYLEDEESDVGQLPYVPFEARDVLLNLRKFSPEEQLLSPKEKRRLQRERLAEFKKDINDQRQGIASAIRHLHAAVEATPDASSQDLFAHVEKIAPEYRFTSSQLKLFRLAIDMYRKKHKAVETYRALHPDDDRLFEACFDRKPYGKVEVLKGPMNFHFRCFDARDYSLAYNFGKVDGSESKITKEDAARAHSSAGVAPRGYSSKIRALEGALTLENIESDSKFDVSSMEKTQEIRGENALLYIDSQEGDIDISSMEGGQWQIKVVKRDEGGFPSRLALTNLDEESREPVFDVVRVKAAKEDQSFFGSGFIKPVSDTEGKKYGNIIGDLRFGGRFYGHVDIDYAFINIVDAYGHGLQVKHRELGMARVPDAESSARVQIHEEQHLFNRLFVPLEERYGAFEINRNVVQAAKGSKEALSRLIHWLLMRERRFLGIDSQARDEILAYYKDGRSIPDIYGRLTKLYDYVSDEDTKEQMKDIPAKVREIVKLKASLYAGDIVDAEALDIDPKEVRLYIERVFKEEYVSDLKRWTDSISLLEQKGYSRMEIISLLYQKTASSWQNLARQLPPKPDVLAK